MNYQKRIKKLQKRLKRKKLDALLVTQPENRRYLCGYTDGDHGILETSGVLLVPTESEPCFLTDSRFLLQAKSEISVAGVELYPKGLLDKLRNLIPALSIKKLAFESHYTLHSVAIKLQEIGEKAGFTTHPVSDMVEKMRIIKDESEIDAIRSSVRLNEIVFRKAYKRISTGMTELELAMLIENSMRKLGASKPSFDTIVASGTNSALPHAVPTSRKIEQNDMLTIDMGLILNGYCSDMTRSFSLGSSKKYKKVHRVVREAQLAAMAEVKAGVRGCDVDKAARDVIKKAGYGNYFGHALGHGVGLAVHEGPGVSPRSKKKLREGMIITIEPGIYIPGWGGIRLENMGVVRPHGFEDFNTDTTELDI